MAEIERDRVIQRERQTQTDTHTHRSSTFKTAHVLQYNLNSSTCL